MKLKIATISDIHNKQLPIFEKSDLLIIAGDYNDCNPNNIIKQIYQFNEFMSSLKQQKDLFDQIIIIFGNHDVFAEKNSWINSVKEYENSFGNLKFLINEVFIYKNLKIYGNPYNNPVNNIDWAFSWNKQNINKTIKQLVKEPFDIIISHAPPFNYLDINIFGKHVGDKYIIDNIKQLPKLWVFGHIHESYGSIYKNNCLFVNASYENSYNFYKHPNKVQYFNIDFEKEE